LLAALAIATGSMSAQALTLGRLQTLSGMGEPLLAEVDITSATPEELQGLRAQIAAPRAFRQAGMEFNPALEGLSPRIENRAGGRSFIVMQGSKPVRDTFVDLILETQWATGQLVRNYALLLNSATDKPAPTAASTAAAPAARVALPATAVPSPVPATQDLGQPRVEYNAQNVPVYRFDTPASSAAATNTSPAPSAMPAPAVQAIATGSSDGTVTVLAGQTASHLALANMPGAVSLDQMLVAMLRNNPRAFIEDNVNLVRAGAVLRMPTAEQAQQTPHQEARQIVLAQTRDFAAYARRLAESPLKVSEGPGRESSGKVSAEVQTKPEQDSQDTLTLSKSQITQNSAEAKVAAAREAKEAADQVADLNKNIEELNSLMSAASAAKPATTEPSLSGGATENAQGKPLWMWGAGLLALLLGLLLWKRQRREASQATFSPSYDDEPSVPASAPAPAAANIPPSMAGIDLNLPANPVPMPQAPAGMAASPAQDTDSAKLQLAQLLLAKGDRDIARTLVQSVAATGSDALKARALQLLGQIR
jgi:pilus assembly protein FimV